MKRTRAQRLKDKCDPHKDARLAAAPPPAFPARALKRGGRGNIHNNKKLLNLWGSFPECDAFVCGTGTSLTGFDWTRLNGRVTIALNDAVKAPGFAPLIHLFSDSGIWSRYRDLSLHPGTIVATTPKGRTHFLRYEDCTFRDQVWQWNHVAVAEQVGKEDDSLFVSRTIATAGIMLAFKLGARRVFCLGVDGYKLSGPAGGTYYHDGRGKGAEKRDEKGIPGSTRVIQDRHGWWRKDMLELRAWFDNLGVYSSRWPHSNVYNLSGNSTITAWQKIKIKTVFGGGCFPGDSEAARGVRSVKASPAPVGRV